jgi:hypothetical protein
MNRHNRSILHTLAATVLAGLALVAQHPALAQVIYRTNFDNPPFMADLPLNGQDSWSAPDILSPNAAVISTAKPRQGQQTVRVWGQDLDHQDFINAVTGGYYDAIGSYRHAVFYDTGGTQIVRVSAHVRVDGPHTPGHNFFLAGIDAVGIDNAGSSNEIGELSISSDGHIYGDSNVDLAPTFLFSARITLGVWHKLAISDDFATHTYSFYVDDCWVGTFPFDPSITSTIFNRGSLLAYTAPDTVSMKKANYLAHYNHFTIQVIGK